MKTKSDLFFYIIYLLIDFESSSGTIFLSARHPKSGAAGGGWAALFAVTGKGSKMRFSSRKSDMIQCGSPLCFM
ncbi:MAG: hypothetical protein JHD35_06060 [Sphingopyxis sp.]|nr:hypothetical protein [Sphingopyxis sp.]